MSVSVVNVESVVGDTTHVVLQVTRKSDAIMVMMNILFILFFIIIYCI